MRTPAPFSAAIAQVRDNSPQRRGELPPHPKTDHLTITIRSFTHDALRLIPLLNYVKSAVALEAGSRARISAPKTVLGWDKTVSASSRYKRDRSSLKNKKKVAETYRSIIDG